MKPRIWKTKKRGSRKWRLYFFDLQIRDGHYVSCRTHAMCIRALEYYYNRGRVG